MTILYSNGCSYTANFDLNRDDRYPIIIAKKLGWQCYDRAEPGSCNSRIIRTTINDCLKLKNQSEEIVALIEQMTKPDPNERTTINEVLASFDQINLALTAATPQSTTAEYKGRYSELTHPTLSDVKLPRNSR